MLDHVGLLRLFQIRIGIKLFTSTLRDETGLAFTTYFYLILGVRTIFKIDYYSLA